MEVLRKMKNKLGILILIVTGIITQAANAELVAHWKLNEGSGDSTTALAGGSEVTDTFTGPTWTTTDLPSLFGNQAALYFDGVAADKIDTTVPGVAKYSIGALATAPSQ